MTDHAGDSGSRSHPSLQERAGATIAGLKGQNLEADWSVLWVIFAGPWLLAIMIGSITLLVSLWIDDYSLALKLFSACSQRSTSWRWC